MKEETEDTPLQQELKSRLKLVHDLNYVLGAVDFLSHTAPDDLLDAVDQIYKRLEGAVEDISSHLVLTPFHEVLLRERIEKNRERFYSDLATRAEAEK